MIVITFVPTLTVMELRTLRRAEKYHAAETTSDWLAQEKAEGAAEIQNLTKEVNDDEVKVRPLPWRTSSPACCQLIAA